MGTGYRPEKEFWVRMGTGYRQNFHLCRPLSETLNITQSELINLKFILLTIFQIKFFIKFLSTKIN